MEKIETIQETASFVEQSTMFSDVDLCAIKGD
jgi:hypothetical protein